MPDFRARALTVLDCPRDADAAVFTSARPRLHAIARQFLGDAAEAEDVVQEAWLRWERTDRSAVHNPPAFLALTTTRLAINVTQSAWKRRESAAGPCLPEPPDPADGLDTVAERHEAIEAAVRLLMERLTPAERGAYLLRKAFDYPYRQIAEVLQLGADHARQLVRRAGERLGGGRRQRVDGVAHRRLVRAFSAAAQDGELAPLEELLAAALPVRKAR
ncbi:sigma-70 family RNA polymerase sigma factor [Nonomuraea sp. NPDC050328]|uniref:sigma-70 family RNA polymerase sigma factor n=1 Tax=Nonomuraea sp. NPDC050328 TaxID=3364361 RepID=UPI00378AC97E